MSVQNDREYCQLSFRLAAQTYSANVLTEAIQKVSNTFRRDVVSSITSGIGNALEILLFNESRFPWDRYGLRLMKINSVDVGCAIAVIAATQFACREILGGPKDFLETLRLVYPGIDSFVVQLHSIISEPQSAKDDRVLKCVMTMSDQLKTWIPIPEEEWSSILEGVLSLSRTCESNALTFAESMQASANQDISGSTTSPGNFKGCGCIIASIILTVLAYWWFQ